MLISCSKYCYLWSAEASASNPLISYYGEITRRTVAYVKDTNFFAETG